MPKRLWIFDTVSLCYFFIAQAENILIKRYTHKEFVPWEVYDEITSTVFQYPGLSRLTKLIEKKIFTVTTLDRKEHAIYSQLIAHLGKGEAACIAIARKRRWIVVTDDRAARKQCAQFSLPVTGTIGILKAACVDKQITGPQADTYLRFMIRQGYYSPVTRISDII